MARDEISEADDGALAAAITRCDEAAMAEAVRRHGGPVLAFARRLVGDGGRAEEISQEVFLRLWERSPRRGAPGCRPARALARVASRDAGRHLADDLDATSSIWNAFQTVVSGKRSVDLVVDTEHTTPPEVARLIAETIGVAFD